MKIWFRAVSLVLIHLLIYCLTFKLSVHALRACCPVIGWSLLRHFYIWSLTWLLLAIIPALYLFFNCDEGLFGVMINALQLQGISPEHAVLIYFPLSVFELLFSYFCSVLSRTRRYLPNHLYWIKYLIKLLELLLPDSLRALFFPAHASESLMLEQSSGWAVLCSL